MMRGRHGRGWGMGWGLGGGMGGFRGGGLLLVILVVLGIAAFAFVR